MRAAVLYGQQDLRLETIADPTPGPGEVIIAVQAATTCGTDLKVWRRGGHARMLKPPILFGHEAAGEIVALGAGVSDWQIGQRIVANNSAPCGDCFYCHRHEYSLCQNLEFNNGTYAEYLKIPAQIVAKNLLAIPEHLPTPIAAMTEPLACVLHGVARCGFSADQVKAWPNPPQVLVIGDGAIGLMFVGVLAQQGATVILSGGSPARLEIGQIFGATTILNHRQTPDLPATIQELTSGLGADIVIEATGVPSVWETAIACTRPGGTVNLFGGCPRDTQITLNTEQLHYGELTLKGVFHNTPSYVRQALQVLSENVIPWSKLITRIAPLSELEATFQAMLNRQVIKAAIDPRA
ncbi:zinc-binding dehydrogenase [Synechococcus sp. PCC 6312]|uniref:zinc-dependent alcohol dehydrogenase n=1 Tax=Synechococcus sp. (strain ATCC 27167 / PCC 6312) TaxID=195253 RepID=UPI00029F443A|nr:zinc-binding dehydrogenase [Synechococcus sp. PCC 6312]AFY62592.1 theronine dehydrogenase-like Zn-dependent dehydrogenase [Synechococcus sp. PCC 6312]